MKKGMFLTFLFCAGLMSVCQAQAQTQPKKEESVMTQSPKILIAYYSLSGNTKQVAQAVHDKTGGDVFEIQTVQAYPEEYRATTEQAKKEIAAGFKPALKANVADISKYDVIFIGSPNWWGTIAPAVSSFLAAHDLSGKTVVPFITHGGGGKQNTVADMTAQCPKCVMKDAWIGYSARTFGVDGWLKDIGVTH